MHDVLLFVLDIFVMVKDRICLCLLTGDYNSNKYIITISSNGAVAKYWLIG